MKKIKILLLLIMCTMLSFTQAQTNLLVNSGFETWTAGVPTGWTLGTATYATVSQNTTLFNEGVSSLKVTAAATSGGTYSITQIVPITPGKTYTLSMSYYIENGDGTDARIWSDWCNVSTTTTYAILSHADSVLLMGPGGGSAYFPDVKSVWKTYTAEVTAPATGYNSFSFQFRTYKTPAVVSWDKMFFGEKTTTDINLGTNDIKSNLDLKIVGKQLTINDNIQGLKLNIYTSTGINVYSSVLTNNTIELKDMQKGYYIISYNNKTKQIIL